MGRLIIIEGGDGSAMAAVRPRKQRYWHSVYAVKGMRLRL